MRKFLKYDGASVSVAWVTSFKQGEFVKNPHALGLYPHLEQADAEKALVGLYKACLLETGQTPAVTAPAPQVDPAPEIETKP